MCQDVVEKLRFSLAVLNQQQIHCWPPTPVVWIWIRKETTAVWTRYRHHDLGFLGQLSHLGNSLTMPGSDNLPTPRISRIEVSIPCQQTIDFTATSTNRPKISIVGRFYAWSIWGTWMKPLELKNKLVYILHISPVWDFAESKKGSALDIVVWLMLSEIALDIISRWPFSRTLIRIQESLPAKSVANLLHCRTRRRARPLELMTRNHVLKLPIGYWL